MEVNVDLVRERLAEVRPVGLRRDIVAAGMVRQVALEDGVARIEMMRGPLPDQVLDATLADIRRVVGSLDGVREVDVKVVQPQQAGAEQAGPIPGVDNIVAVSSTKGGVGKSTVSVNLACSLAAAGARVGLLDADIYGPSVPMMLGKTERPDVTDDKKVLPLEAHGVRFISMGLLLDDTSPVIWRGPLVTGVLRQFLKDVLWGDLDVLVVDLPPGTGDAQLTLTQHVPVTGAVVVTTPQDVSLIDVERGIAMFRQVNIPVFGVVENMSGLVCGKCGYEDALFGEGGGDSLSERFGVPVLAKLPITEEVRVGGDSGVPLVVRDPSHAVSKAYADLAASVRGSLSDDASRAPAPKIIG